jgi:hexosaminidase
MMKTIKQGFFLAAVMLIATISQNAFGSTQNNQRLTIIPLPVKMDLKSGSFGIKKNTVIYCHQKDLIAVANYLNTQISGTLGFTLEIKDGTGKGINLQISDKEDKTIGTEGYRIHVTNDNLFISANKPNGIFYGVHTLIQMFPPGSTTVSLNPDAECRVRCVDIEDMPRFQWRGLLLDVSRHFFTIDEVKRMIDEMSAYKFNLLQLHLTDDQGWRIEIKKLPLLTQVGAWRVPRTGLWWERECPQPGEKATYGGFYTQEEIKDLVKYAGEHFVNILPEIEAPGHSLAAIASYPYLSSAGKSCNVNPGCKFYGIEDNTLCPGKESTFEFLNTVFGEVADLFPFEYIHIGGDECYKGFWKKCDDCQKRIKENGLKDENELQSYLVKRLEKILEAKGKKLIGWDEILEGGLAPNAAVMSWRGMEGGIAAVKAKHHVVMCPAASTYLDFYQGDPAIEPPTYNMLRLKTAYTYEPVPEGVDSSFILGGQGNLWSESVPTFRHAEYMLWPRSFALAEVLWSPKVVRDWPDFVRRTETQLQKFSERDINYSRSFYDAIITPSKDEKGNLRIELDTEIDGFEIYYTFDNTYPDNHSSLYKKGEKLPIQKDADTFRVITFKDGKPIGRIITVPIADLEKRLTKN